ncbi:short-chain dehydrogenase/reductase SDR [Hymenobacter roseosalivarius DSM 11622]|uniref:Short-chain dehydrogenase/reductase SDR n=1 Tax=Hymenobacter roseosalivarius DSM 11622 TaxID=645990 RepID=A0A1W1W1I8_9BACT|nr:SDR family NAD(P)-dependent oxidoreductase [Hymenobacter roseosalivarius]SMB99350.1 short-chain dehydrogenase/reductase SDR [Hymenobacter roseosalivarius DSM 11622]
MDTHSHTVLITGGATGIGLALARRFAEAGNTVLICGRRPDALAAAQALEPRLHTFVADIAVSGRARGVGGVGVAGAS